MDKYSNMFQSVTEYIQSVELAEPPPFHSQLSSQWWNTVYQDIEQITEDTNEKEQVEEIIDCLETQYSYFLKYGKLQKELETKRKAIEAIRSRPQVAQRTEEWYAESQTMISASEFWQLFTSDRSRAAYVLQKCGIQPKEPKYLDISGDEMIKLQSQNRHTCLSMEMTALDWGIRFEPVAKQILEKHWSSKIDDVGRLYHPTISKLAASPDGLIVEGPPEYYGRLVEIKCPVSREIGKGIPLKYWYQVQLQLEVSEIDACYYSELNIQSLQPKKMTLDESELKKSIEKGVLYLIQSENLQDAKYVYGPLGEMDWVPILEPTWEILERIPWYLTSKHIEFIKRDKVWFHSIIPLLTDFWKDVEKAKEGNFQVPEPKPKKKKIELCAIVD
jgi:hypothetical protein